MFWLKINNLIFEAVAGAEKKVTKPPYLLCNKDKAQVLRHKAEQKLGFNARLCDDGNILIAAN